MTNKTSERILLIDGDILVYEIAAGMEQATDWGDGLWTLHAQAAPAIARLRTKLDYLEETLQADRLMIALSDSQNWRKDVFPDYKSNRKDVRRPMLLSHLQTFLKENYDCYIHPQLEADDVLGILATWKKLKGQKIIVTKDKDLATIPCQLYFLHKPDLGVQTITDQQADFNHLVQTLAGDSTDGYGGCPSVGLATARAALRAHEGIEPYQHTFKTGKRKGETEQRWRKKKLPSLWQVVVSYFEKAGLTEQDALIQARVARICRASDYDFKGKKVKLWMP